MVKVGIIDADSPLAGELIRILVNHPETEIKSLYSPSVAGHSVVSKHHGLIGESNLNFSDKIALDELDLVVIQKESDISKRIISQSENFENLKVIALSKTIYNYLAENTSVIGLSEINRKALVRGANKAYLVNPVIVPSLIALIPLANFLLLNTDISIEVSAPKDIIDSISSIQEEVDELTNQLKNAQASFNGNIEIKLSINKSPRQQITKISFNNSLPLDELEKIYEQTYDDHNFTFISKNYIKPEEVEGTQKVVINLEKENSERLSIQIVSDARMRGGAGDIVHVMNLFFGLHEKTGLRLKASPFISSSL